MVVITITRWKRKLALFMAVILLVVGLGVSLNWFLSPEDSATSAPSENLQNDVLTQPVKVQGNPGQTIEQSPQPQQPASGK